MRKPVVGVMGASENDGLSESEKARVKESRRTSRSRSGAAGLYSIHRSDNGLPDLVAKAFRNNGGFALGISPAHDRREHLERYGLPEMEPT